MSLTSYQTAPPRDLRSVKLKPVTDSASNYFTNLKSLSEPCLFCVAPIWQVH